MSTINFKRIVTVVLLGGILASGSNLLMAAGINFDHRSWSEIVERAKVENRLIFIDFYTQWCGPCYNMAKTVFTDADVAAFYNNSFVNAKIDAEVGEGIELAKKYGIHTYPSYIFVDPATQECVHRSSSRQSAEQFIATGAWALNPAKRSFKVLSDYEKGDRSRTLLIDYIVYTNSLYRRDDVRRAFDELIATGVSLRDKDVWSIFDKCITGSDNNYLREVSDNYQAYCDLYGKDQVDNKLARETSYADIALLDEMCDFDGKDFNRRMILINNDIRAKNYDKAADGIDAMIADPAVDGQKLIDRLKFIARISPYYIDDMPEPWLMKCLGYLRYIAYNNYDRDDASVHQEYASAIEQVMKRIGSLPESMMREPEYGKKSYSMRPDELKAKPKR